LAGLVAANEKDDAFITSLRVAHPVAWPDIDLELRDAAGKVAVLAGVAVC
jgi:hypothetical protein